jgi:hypothetical protein
LSGLRLSFRKSAMVLKSGASLPSSQITSIPQCGTDIRPPAAGWNEPGADNRRGRA